MKKKIVTGLCLWLVGCLCGLMLARIHYAEKESEVNLKKSVLIEYGNTFPIERLSLLEENKTQKVKKLEKHSIYLYIDPYCDSCIEKISIIERLYNILEGDIEINILWNQKPKTEISDKVNIPETNQYIADQIELLNEYPLYFITDSDGKVVMITDEENKLLKKISGICGEKELISKTNAYLQTLAEDRSLDKQMLVYFSMEGCPDCQNIEHVLEEINAKEKYDMITVYTDESYGSEPYVDIGKIFLTIYDIDWYPSFLILSEDQYKFVGNEIETELIEILQNGL